MTPALVTGVIIFSKNQMGYIPNITNYSLAAWLVFFKDKILARQFCNLAIIGYGF